MTKNRKKIINLEIIITVIFILFSITTSVIFYFYLSDFHANTLKKYLVTIAKNAALQLNGDQLQEITDISDKDNSVFINTVDYLNLVRDNNQDVKFVYLMRKTDQVNYLSFIADADSLKTDQELDQNNNGIVEEFEKKSEPGDLYNIDDIPAILEAFNEPSYDEEITVDQWGEYISGYAPVRDSNNQVVAILGVDLSASDYYQMQARVEIIIYILVSILFSILAIIFIIIRQYHNEIKILHNIDEQKSDFISLASHQLRTPLSASKWCIDMLQEGDFGSLGEEQRKAIGNLCSVNTKMVNLVNDLLKVFQVDADKLRAKFVVVNISEICEKIIQELNFLIIEKKVIVKLNISENIKNLKTDPDLLKEILLNLLTNAIKYTTLNKEVVLDISSEKEKIIFKIIDQGYGIPEDEKDRVFTKFYRASNITKKDPNGTGLGLYFVKKVVEFLGGKIDFKSIENQGSTFYFYLPND